MAVGDVGDYGLDPGPGSDKRQDSEVKLFYPNDDDCAGGGGGTTSCLVQA